MKTIIAIKDWYAGLGPKMKFTVAFSLGAALTGGAIEVKTLLALFGL